MSASFEQLASELVSAATGRTELVAALRPPAGPVTLPSPLPVARLAATAVGAASVAAAALAYARSTGREVDVASLIPVVLDGPRVTAAYRSEQVFTWNGERPDAWAPASGFFETADGWVRTHGNYPHHAAALRRMLGLGDDAGKDAIAAALRTATGAHWEDRAAAEGAIVGRVRTVQEWRTHPHADAVRAYPLVRRGVADPGRIAADGAGIVAAPRGRPGARPHAGDRRTCLDPHPRTVRGGRAAHRQSPPSRDRLAVPGHRPGEALDHTAGYLLAASVMSALELRHLTGAVSHVGVSLARVALTLLDGPRSSVPAPTPTPDETWREQTVDLAVAGGGSLHCAAPAPVWNGSALAYPATIVRYGSSVAAW